MSSKCTRGCLTYLLCDNRWISVHIVNGSLCSICRTRALRLCCWGFDKDSASLPYIDQLEREREFERAAAVAVFTLRMGTAIAILNNGSKLRETCGKYVISRWCKVLHEVWCNMYHPSKIGWHIFRFLCIQVIQLIWTWLPWHWLATMTTRIHSGKTCAIHCTQNCRILTCEQCLRSSRVITTAMTMSWYDFMT